MRRVFTWRERKQQFLNALIPKWSTLSAIGVSTPAKLAVAAPLIGYLVIYNDFFASFFFFSSGKSEYAEDTLLELLKSKKLTFLYFGLLVFGLGSVIFSLFAPRHVRDFKSAEDYVERMERIKTHWLVIEKFEEISETIDLSDFDGQFSNSFDENEEKFGRALWPQFIDLLIFMGEQSAPIFHLPENGSAQDTNDDIGFCNAIGNVIPARVLECVLTKRRALREVWQSALHSLSEDRSMDLFHVYYRWSNQTQIFWRGVCALCFLVGFSLLSVPTIITSIQVLSNLR